jgi:CBS domain-containing protein
MGLLRLAQKTPELEPEATVIAAVRLMMEQKVGAVAVKEGRKLVGIFTERDLMSRVVLSGKDAKTTPLREAMTSPVETVLDSTIVGEAMRIMRAKHMRHVAVVDDKGELLGILGLRYLMYAVMDDLATKVGDLQNYLMTDGPGG